MSKDMKLENEVTEYKSVFPERLQEALEMRGLRQSDLADRTGLSTPVINRYVKGVHEPRESKIALIANALNVPMAWLLGFDVKVPANPKAPLNLEDFEVEEATESNTRKGEKRKPPARIRKTVTVPMRVKRRMNNYKTKTYIDLNEWMGGKHEQAVKPVLISEDKHNVYVKIKKGD